MGIKLSNSNGIVIILPLLQKPCIFTSVTWIILWVSQNLSAPYRNPHLALSYKSQARTPLAEHSLTNSRSPSWRVSRCRSRSVGFQSRYKRSSRRVQSGRTLHSSRLWKPIAPSTPHIWRHHTADHEVIELSTVFGKLKPISWSAV